MAEQVHETVFFIEGKCGVTLDTTLHQGKAIKDFICDYRGKVEDARLCMVTNSRKHYMNPCGTPADYS